MEIKDINLEEYEISEQKDKKEGKYDKNGECLIFPSKENRDWDAELKRKRSQLLPFNTLVMPSIDGNIGS